MQKNVRSIEKNLDRFLLTPSDEKLIASAKSLVRKVIRSGKLNVTAKESASRLLYILSRMPEVTPTFHTSFIVSGPQQIIGDVTTYMTCGVGFNNQKVFIGCGGYIDQPGRNGDGFMTMHWEVSPGKKPKLQNFKNDFSRFDYTPEIPPFEKCVKEVDFKIEGFTIALTASECDFASDEIFVTA